MANITNVQRAFNQISEKSLAHEGDLTRDIFMGFFNHAVGNFNLNEEKVKELMEFKYPREIIMAQSGSYDMNLPGEQVKGISGTWAAEHESKFTDTDKGNLIYKGDLALLEKIDSLEKHVESLTGALAKIGTLTGYGNHLREFGIDKWEPTKKDMNKYG